LNNEFYGSFIPYPTNCSDIPIWPVIV
jgi:hypothetical protein